MHASDLSPAPLARRRAAPTAARAAVGRTWKALGWTAGAAAVFALYLRIATAGTTSSDPANNAMQAWDMLHGHLLLHGWILGDVTFYTFELPLMALAELIFGLHTIAVHVTVALVLLIVTGCAVAIAVTDSRGAARVVRAGVVVAVLAAPALVVSDFWITLGFPDHTGTIVFLLVACLLIDRAFNVRYSAPLLCAVLVAGQIGDVTVRYVTVPAVIVVCAYRVLAARKLRTRDAANLVAAAVSLPLATGVRALMLHLGAYQMDPPQTRIAPYSQWGQNAAYTWHSLRMLFGTVAEPNTGSAGRTAIFGFACLAVATAGGGRVLWRWRRARRAEQLLLVAIVINIVVYLISTVPTPETPHDIVGVLAAGAILGARALVPDRLRGRRTALAAVSAAVIAALLPLSLTATRATQVPPLAGLTAWLKAHGLRYGLGGYWNGSAVTLQSGDQVRVRSVVVIGGQITPDPWENNTAFFDPSQHYANFVVFHVADTDLGANMEGLFGKPVSASRVGNFDVLIYDWNVLQVVRPPVLNSPG